MHGKILREHLPRNYAFFIITALLPQILGFNGSILDTIWKILVVAFFFLLGRANLTRITGYSLLYICIYISGSFFTLILNKEKITDTVTNIVLTILLVILFVEFSHRAYQVTIEDILKFYQIYAFFMLVACIYNMLLHPTALLHLRGLSLYGAEYISSFFDNKNTFGFFLIFGTLAALILRYYTKQLRWVVLITVFILNELMAMCRTAIVLSCVLLVISFLISAKGITLRRVLAVGVVILVLVGVALRFASIRDYIFGTLFASTDSLETRQGYIESMKSLLHGVHLLFGYGRTQSAELAQIYTGNHYYHNSYLSILISNGLVGLGLLLSVILASALKGIEVFRIDRATGLICILSCVVYLVYAYVEAAILFTTPVIAMVATVFVVSLPTFFHKAVVPKNM